MVKKGRELIKPPGEIKMFIDCLPLLIPVCLALFGSLGMLLLVTGLLYNYLVVGAAIASAVCTHYIFKRVGVCRSEITRERHVFNLLVLLLVAGWVLVNSYYSSQN